MRLEDGLSAPRASVRVLKRALLDAQATEGVEVKAGDTVAETVAARTPNLTDDERRALRVVSYERDAEHVIAPELWHRVKLKPGAFLVITDPPAGGAFRSILQIVVAVAALALAGPLGGMVGTALGIGATAGGALVAAGIGIVGNLLVNALVPVRDSLGDERPSPLYTLEGFKNQPDIGGPVPLPVGLRHRYAPKYIVPPYIDVEDDKIFMNAVFCCGYAPMKRWNERIGDRALSRFDSRTYQVEYRGFMKDDGTVDVSPFTIVRETVVQRGQNITLKYREDGIDEEDEGPRSEPTLLQTEPDTMWWKGILSFPQGLNRRGDKGSLGAYNVDIEIKIRPVTPGNDADWTLVENISINRRTINPFYTELGPYEVPDGFRGAYEVSFWRMSSEGTGGDETAQCDIIGIQSIMEEYPINQPIDCPFAMVALRIQATNQLKGTLDEYNLELASLIDAWNHETEEYDQFKETGNPADWYRRLLTMPQNAKRIPPSHLFEDEIRDWHDHCRTNDLEFSRVYDYEISLDAAIRDVCAVGRAVPRTTGGLRGVSIDRRKDPLTAFPLTPHNTWGFEGKREFKENDTHGFRMKFRDRTNDFKTAIREVIRPDLPDGVEATNFQEIEPPGITHPKQIYIEGFKRWLEVIHRPDAYTNNIDIQSRLLQHGDLGAISHRLIHQAQRSGAVVAVRGNVVAISEDVDMAGENDYAVKFQRIEEVGGGDAVTKVLVRSVKTVAGTSRLLQLTGSGELPEVGDLAWFGRSSMEDMLAVIQNLEPNDDLNARLTLVDQANQIFDILDDLVVPPWSSRVGSILPNDDSPPPRPVVKRILSSRSVYGRDETMQKDPRRVVAYVAPGIGLPKAAMFQVRHRKESEAEWTLSDWLPFAAGSLTIDDVYKKGDDIRVAVRARTRLLIDSDWSDARSHVVGSADLPGPIATDLAVDRYEDGRMSYWWLPPADVVTKARLYYGPASADEIEEMTPLHSGYLTAAPYEVTKPTAPGNYKFAVVLEAEDGTVGDPAFAAFDIPNIGKPWALQDFTATAQGSTIRFVGVANGDDPWIYRIQFRIGPSFDTAEIVGQPRADAGDERRSSTTKTPGTYQCWGVAVNRLGEPSLTPSGPSPVTIV